MPHVNYLSHAEYVDPEHVALTFQFLNRSRTLVKLLHWEAGGLVIYYKRLEKGTFRPPEGMEAGGKLVTPGLIDLHAHTYPFGSAIGIPADARSAVQTRHRSTPSRSPTAHVVTSAIPLPN